MEDCQPKQQDLDIYSNCGQNGLENSGEDVEKNVGVWMENLTKAATGHLHYHTSNICDTEVDDQTSFLESAVPNSMFSGIRIQKPSAILSNEIEDDERPIQSFQEKRRKMNKKKRVVKKDGLTNVTYKNISKKRRRYISDIYTTLLDSDWHWCIAMFVIGFYGSWFLFGSIYYMICYLHGDFEDSLSEGWIPCVEQVDGFAACFLFSLETQHTIGYGTRHTTTECPDAMLVVSVQAVLGCLIQAFMVGLVFSKLSRPRNRSKTIIFSNQAVITQRNKKLCLIIRIGDLRDDNFILGTQISAKLMRRRVTLEGEMYQEMQNVKIDPETSSESCIFFVWPLDIVHVIDKDSPFYDMSSADLAKERFELLLIMEGTNETSNMTFQARTSYLPNEIVWGQRFEQMLLYRKDNNKFQVNFAAFHSTYDIETPACSARELDQIYKAYDRKISTISSFAKMANVKSPTENGNRKTSQLTIPENSFQPSPSNISSTSSRFKRQQETDRRVANNLNEDGNCDGLNGFPSKQPEEADSDSTYE